MNSNVLITGASRGLGLEFARTYLEKGWTVFAGARNPSCAALAGLKESFGSGLTVVQLDVADTDSVQAAAVEVRKRGVTLGLLINNAAISTSLPSATLEKVNFSEAGDIYNVNALGPLRAVLAFGPLMEKGSVVANISSEAGGITVSSRSGEFEYCMSKAALNMASKLLHTKLKPLEIKVLALHPGWIRTDMGGANACGDPADAASKLAETIEMRRSDYDGPIFLDYNNQVLDW